MMIMIDHRLEALTDGIAFTDDLASDVSAFLTFHLCSKTAAHCRAVSAEARQTALKTGINPQQAEIAGWLHDVSAVIAAAERADIAEEWGLAVLPEEAAFPMIIHQKLSVVLAREVFGVRDDMVLSAIGCHTTLKANASALDKVVFVADKLAWDQPGNPPYHAEMKAALEHSLDAAALVYLQYLWERRETLKVIHPWMRAAYLELTGRC
jgi:predicted HD superfamily hydrolase involved in NAD metabolism